MTKKGLYQPPKLAQKFFRWYCRQDRLEELEGDLEEFFYLRKHQGQPLWKARLFFWWNVLRCYRNYSKTQNQRTMTYYPLFKSYLKLAFRHSWKNKWSVLVNITGLGMALSMCIFVYTLYAYNLEFDDFYDVQDVYRLNSMTMDGGKESRNDLSPMPLDNVLRNKIANVQQVAGYADFTLNVKVDNEYFQESVGLVSDDFFKMFHIPLWYGSYRDFGEKPIVFLSKPTAQKYFGQEVALGKTIIVHTSSSKKIEVNVAGVFDHIPLNTSFDMDMIIGIKDYAKTAEIDIDDWKRKFYISHFIKANKKSVASIEKELNAFVPRQNEGHPSMKMHRFEFIPFQSEIHKNDNMYRNNTNSRLDDTVYIVFTTLAALVFLIACFNLANTSMALIAKRLKEIGIRKTLGSANKQILVQFLVEMGVVCFLAFIVGLSLTNFTANFILGLFGVSFGITEVDITGIVIFIILFLSTTTLVAGIMPALYAWKFQPITIMRKSTKLKGVGWVNKSLTTLQYAFSIAVLASAVSFARNQDFLDSLDLGYINEGIYVLDLNEKSDFPKMKQKMDQLPGVSTVGTIGHVQLSAKSSRREILKLDTAEHEIRTYTVGAGYIEHIGIPIIEGRAFIKGSQTDQKSSIIVNQEFGRQFFKGKELIGKQVQVDNERKTIVGVYANIIHDVYTDSEDEAAVFIYKESDEYPYLIAKVSDGNIDAFEAEVKKIWSEEIDAPFDGGWQKDLAYGTAVSDTENLRTIFLAMAILSGILSIAGLFSLSKLNVAKRVKEISIRKVLGSSFRQLFLVVNKSFFIILSVAIVFGCLIGYLLSSTILSMIYQYHVAVTPMTSLASGIFIVLMALAIMTLAILSPMRANPVAGLRQE